MPEHGDISRNENSGRGSHPIEGFTDVTDEAARIAKVQAGSDRGRVQYQSAGRRPGRYVAEGTTGKFHWLGQGSAPQELVATKTDANDGDTIGPGTLWVCQLFHLSADYQLFIPDVALDDIGEGDVVRVLVTGSVGGRRRLRITSLGGSIVGGMGMGPGGLDIYLQGDFDIVEFIASKSFGQWIATGVTKDTTNTDKGPVFAATSGPLPSFSTSGTGPNEQLTGTANGELLVDGVPLSAMPVDQRQHVAVVAETGTNRRYHGLYDVIQAGDGGNPFIIQRATNWCNVGHLQRGARFHVETGATNAGRIFHCGVYSSYNNISHEFQRSGRESPVMYTALGLNSDVDDYAPSGIGDGSDWNHAEVVRIQATTAVRITGLLAPSGPPEGAPVRTLINVNAWPITLGHLDTGSAGANRVRIPGGADIIMQTDDAVTLWYDPLTVDWRVI